MKLAAVRALAELAQAEPSEIVALAYGEPTPAFGPDYLIPRAFDPRLIVKHRAGGGEGGDGQRRRDAADRGLRRLSRASSTRFVYQSGTTMEPVFAAAQAGAEARRLRRGRGRARAARGAGRASTKASRSPSSSAAPTSSQARIEQLGLRLKLGDELRGVNILDDPRYRDYWQEYYQLARRKGVSRAQAMEEMRSRPTLIGAMLVRRGDADAMLCGTLGNFADHLRYVRNVDRPARGREDAGGDADADPARPAALHLRHARQSRSERRSRSPR